MFKRRRDPHNLRTERRLVLRRRGVLIAETPNGSKQPSNLNSAPDAPTSDEGSGKSGVEEVDGQRVIHDATRPRGGHRPRASTAIRIEPRNHLIELTAKSPRWNCDPDPNGKLTFS